MVRIPEGNLLRAAEAKSIPNLSALKEKTGVDRKTLRAINAGQPVKRTTVQTIADKLRIPIEHLLASNSANKNQDDLSSSDEYQFGEIKLQRLDSAALRKLAGEAHRIAWFLDVDQMSDELEAALLKLRDALAGWFEHLNIGPSDPDDNLASEISYIKTSADIDKGVEELTRRNLKIFGGTYVFWDKTRPFSSELRKPLPVLKYLSELRAALKFTPEDKTSPTVRVGIGWVPPREFVESKLRGIDFVEVDRTQVWFRESNFDDETTEMDTLGETDAQ
jgi:hypothetical protein